MPEWTWEYRGYDPAAERLREVLCTLPSDDPETLAVPGDLARPGNGAQVVEQALARFGRIDTLVNNAGVFIGKPYSSPARSCTSTAVRAPDTEIRTEGSDEEPTRRALIPQIWRCGPAGVVSRSQGSGCARRRQGPAFCSVRRR